MTTTRQAFETYIEMLVVNKAQGNDWSALAVNHYDDEMREAVRRDVVRLMIDNADPTGSFFPIQSRML